MALAIPVAALAGLVSFFSPCVLPLLPGYLSYATGMAAGEIAEGRGRSRVLAGTLLFVAGFALVFVATGALIGSLGGLLLTWRRPITVVVGLLTIALGLLFAGWLPIGRGTVRFNLAPRVGVAAAPLLGIVFGLGWTPCIGPALSVVLNLALNEATALRGGLLAFVYALGLGLPFVIAGLAFTRMGRAIGWVKRHHLAVQRTGGIVMIVVGILLVTGWWDIVMSLVQQWVSTFEVVI
ncbi:MAG: cytochrome C biogenesis protein [Propionibacteriaceae bacterium]|nr:cytochrome C biogenesis protein [Propionibacteriaceae bacterium]